MPSIDPISIAFLKRVVKRAFFDCDTFYVDNQSTQPIGNCLVSDGSTSSINVFVNAQAVFPREICFTATTITINGSSIGIVGGSAQLMNGHWVDITWTSPNAIVIADGLRTTSMV
jgi:hypothetical protein